MSLLRHLVKSSFSRLRSPLLESLSAQNCNTKTSHIRLCSFSVKENLQRETIKELQPNCEGEEEEKITVNTISKINQQINEKTYGRLFAVVHICGKQFKVTTDDLIIIEGYWPPNIGEKLNLAKILLVGGCDFTLIGRPILPQGLVSVQATVIEKLMSHTKTRFRKKRRKQYMRINFHRSEYTMLRINTIELNENVGKTGTECFEDNML